MSDDRTPDVGTICGVGQLKDKIHHGHQSKYDVGSGHGALVSDSQHELVGAEYELPHAEIGKGGATAEVKGNVSAYKFQGEESEIKVLEGHSDAGLGAGRGGVKAKVEVGADLVNATTDINEDWEVSGNFGCNVSTGFEIGSEGVSVNCPGFGLSLGKQTGAKIPFGGVMLSNKQTNTNVPGCIPINEKIMHGTKK